MPSWADLDNQSLQKTYICRINGSGPYNPDKDQRLRFWAFGRFSRIFKALQLRMRPHAALVEARFALIPCLHIQRHLIDVSSSGSQRLLQGL